MRLRIRLLHTAARARSWASELFSEAECRLNKVLVAKENAALVHCLNTFFYAKLVLSC